MAVLITGQVCWRAEGDMVMPRARDRERNRERNRKERSSPGLAGELG